MIKNTTTITIILWLLTGCQKSSIIGDSELRLEQKFWGVWQSSGYGYVVSINEKIELYDISDQYCLKQDIDSPEIKEYFPLFEYINPHKIGISQSLQSKTYYFNRIDQLPARCQTQLENNAKVAFQYFTDLMSTHYAFFDVYEVNWENRVNRSMKTMDEDMSEQDLADIFQALIADINDSHLFINTGLKGEYEQISNDDSRFLTPALDASFARQSKIKNRNDYGLKWYEKTLENILAKLLENPKTEANDEIIWGEIGDIGYIKIRNMRGFSESGQLKDEIKTVNSAIQSILSSLSNKSSIIIDLTTNSGGADEIGREMVNYFTNKRQLIYSHLALGSKEPPQEYYTNPQPNPYLGTVYLYTSDHTVSAAETFAMAMKALPNVTHVGTTTRGAFSDILDKTLPNGWQVGLSNMFYWDANGKNWEGKGLKPDIEIPVFTNNNIVSSHLLATQKLISDIHTKSL